MITADVWCTGLCHRSEVADQAISAGCKLAIELTADL